MLIHPVLMQSGKGNNFDRLDDIIKDPLRKRAELALFGFMSSPPKIIFYDDYNGV